MNVFSLEPYRLAFLNPFQSGVNSKLLLGKSFSYLEENQEKIINDNKWAMVARRIAKFLSDLPTSEIDLTRSYDNYGNYVNFVAQVLCRILLEKEGIIDAKNYIQRVDLASQQVFGKVENSKSFLLKQQNFWQELNTIDVPDKKYAKNIEISLDKNEIAEQFSQIFSTAFKTTIIQRDNTTNGSSLRAIPSDDVITTLTELVKKCILDSGIIESFDKLQILDRATSVILEGKEIHTWVEKTANELELTLEEYNKLTVRTPEAIQKAAVNTVFESVLKRMQDFIDQYPTFPFTPEGLALFFIQDFYPGLFGVKENVNPKLIDMARDTICPGIGSIQYPRVTYMRVELEPIELFSSSAEDAGSDFGDPSLKNKIPLLDYLRQVQTVLQDVRLDVVIRQLENDDAAKLSRIAFEKFQKMTFSV